MTSVGITQMLQDDRREVVGRSASVAIALTGFAHHVQLPEDTSYRSTSWHCAQCHFLPILFLGWGNSHVVTEDDLCFGYHTQSLNCAEQNLGTIWMNGSFASDFNGSMISPRHLSCISYISFDEPGWKPRPGPCHLSQGRPADTRIWGVLIPIFGMQPDTEMLLSFFNCNQVWGLWGFYHHGENYPPPIQNSGIGAKTFGKQTHFSCHCNWDVLPNSQVYPNIHVTNAYKALWTK